ncbi:MAG: hypothetical protein QXS93_03110 [Candidatus Micrarchaeia archaeon]
MDRTLYILLLVLPVVFLSGCCGPATSYSSSCPYGTYGETCTKVCKSVGGKNCFSQCIDNVRAEGLGDATTCCKETFLQNCRSKCKGVAYGEDLQDCYAECDMILESTGLDKDICYLPFL